MTPTCSHAERTTSATSGDTASAAVTVAAAKAAKSVSAEIPEVSAAYQIVPAPSQLVPPMPVAARWKALLGMPELVCTPPLSSWVST